MRVLITNSHEVQAYTILRSLRAEAEHIVVATGVASVTDHTYGGLAPYSRFADARYEVPAFSDDWMAGRLQPDNTAAEERYIRRVEEICATEKLDTVFPSLDPEVYLFAKNKRRLFTQGVLAVVPDLDTLRIPMDKAATMRAALQSGFPCPQTYFPQNASDLDEILSAGDGPWMVKPRFTAHAQNMEYVDSADQLAAAYARVAAHQGTPLVQEFIPGNQRRNYYITVGRDNEIISLLTPKVLRTQCDGFRVSTTACLSASAGPYVDEMRSLVRELKLWGGYTIQTKVDPRDSTPKLMEINTRLGQHLWWRTGLGVNEPRILVQLARGEAVTGTISFPDDVLLLDPYHDSFVLFSATINAIADGLFRLMGRSSPHDPDKPGLAAILRYCARDYLNFKRKVFCPEVSALISDPYPCLRAFGVRLRRLLGTLRVRAMRVTRGVLRRRRAH